MAICLCAVVSATRTKRADRSASAASDFTAIVNRMKEVDYHAEEDLFTIFETDGSNIEEVVTPKPSECSLNSMKTELLECPKRGKVCIALYKFNYPRSLDSSTLKAKSALLYLLDEQAMKASLGSFIKAKQVTMGFTQFLWGALKNNLSKNSVSPAGALELIGSESAESLDGEKIWGKFKSGAGRVDKGEEAAFLKHVKDQNAKTAGAAPDTTKEGSNGDSTGDSTGGSREVPVAPVTGPPTQVAAPVDTKAIIEEVEAAVSKSVEDIARKIAREEVGMAIRKLGTDIGEKTKAVGKLWMDKAKGIA